jgi:ketosteroid isomerase-like protein
MTPADIGARIRAAIEAGDDVAMAALLDPDVRWGAPDDPEPSCLNREQVLAWYRRGRERGVRARVTEVVAQGDRILVGLAVTGNAAAADAGGEADRWQVLSVSNGLVVDIRAYDDRAEAAGALDG